LLCAALVACAPNEPVESQVEDDGSVRIVSLAPNLTELAFQAGAGGQLVAAVEYSDYPPAALELPRIGDAFRIDFEQLRALDPDLILVWESGNPVDMQARLVELGYTLLVLEPKSIEDVADHLRTIGQYAGTSEIADAAALDYLRQLDEVWNSYGAEPDISVFFQISAAPWFTVNGDHVISQILGRCGGRNVFADIPVIAGSVSLESILAANPEVIVAPVAGPDDIEWREQWARFDGIAAVQADAFIDVGRDEISRSSMRLADGARQICSGLSRIRKIRNEL
jgi:iron complex transport system substrate-binding protein